MDALVVGASVVGVWVGAGGLGAVVVGLGAGGAVVLWVVGSGDAPATSGQDPLVTGSQLPPVPFEDVMAAFTQEPFWVPESVQSIQ